MAYEEIDLKALRAAIDIILDHLTIDLGLEKIIIEEGSDHYWHCPASEVNDMSKIPTGMDIGRLRDDVNFVNLIRRGQSGDISYNFVHIAPLLRYIGEKVKQ